MTYAELQVTSNFTFLEGGSHPDELVLAAAALGLRAIAITDRNSLAGVVRAHRAAKSAGIRLIVGARLDLTDGASLLCLPKDREAYGRLCQLLTLGRRRAEKGECLISRQEVIAAAEGQMLLLLPPERPGRRFVAELADWRRRHADLGLVAQHRFAQNDSRRLALLARIAEENDVRLVATNDVLYHSPERRKLQDVLTAIRLGCRVDQAGRRLAAHAERHLKPPAEMARLFAAFPDAISQTLHIAEACSFSLDELRYDYPIASADPQADLVRLTWEGAARRYPGGLPRRVRQALEHELALIAQLSYAPYFLTVHDIVRFAQQRGILCQGRGSAANSAVCYCLGVTAVDPMQFDLLFERFISAARNEPPDIDVDFEHERREEVIQYIYGKYGRERAGLAATIIHYRSRSALREVGRAMGLSEDAIAALAKSRWGRRHEALDRAQLGELGFDPEEPTLALTLDLAGQLTGFPRHLSQHVGGFVMTQGRLDRLVPVENARMAERTVIQWDKDDLDAVGLLKVDVLALGMLTCIRKAFELLRLHHGIDLDLARVPREDKAVYDMLCRADSIGVFQIESRAQMSMLPRLKPRCFYDLVIEVAIVRPGPIQGDMVHPYLRRRQGREKVDYPSEELRAVLHKTLGVPLFQEQAMKIAIVAAGFTPDEADQLRRAMASFRHFGTVSRFKGKLIDGMVAKGYDPDFAERVFRQIEGFGDYGFPESHAASFAHLVYVSAWLKCHQSGRLRLRFAQQPADGLLRPGADRRRCPRPWRRGQAGRHQSQRLGLHAGTGRAAPGLPPDQRLFPQRRRPTLGQARRRLSHPRGAMAAQRPARGGPDPAGRRRFLHFARPVAPAGAVGGARLVRPAAAFVRGPGSRERAGGQFAGDEPGRTGGRGLHPSPPVAESPSAGFAAAEIRSAASGAGGAAGQTPRPAGGGRAGAGAAAAGHGVGSGVPDAGR